MRDPVFEGINPDELEGPAVESKWRKPLIIAGGILLALLVFSWSFSDSLSGIIQSKTTNNAVLYFPNDTVIFQNNVLELLQNEFVSNEHREIKACLFGSVDNGVYYIGRVEFPEVIRANVIHVVSVACPSDVLIDLHSHPINRCLASEQDVSVFEELKQRNPLVRMMVMCSSNRFSIL